MCFDSRFGEPACLSVQLSFNFRFRGFFAFFCSCMKSLFIDSARHVNAVFSLFSLKWNRKWWLARNVDWETNFPGSYADAFCKGILLPYAFARFLKTGKMPLFALHKTNMWKPTSHTNTLSPVRIHKNCKTFSLGTSTLPLSENRISRSFGSKKLSFLPQHKIHE